MTQLTPAPVDCCRPCCRDLVLVTAAGGSNADLWGEADPNTAGVVPANTALWGIYHQLIPGTSIEMTRWNWNPDASPQQWQ